MADEIKKEQEVKEEKSCCCCEAEKAEEKKDCCCEAEKAEEKKDCCCEAEKAEEKKAESCGMKIAKSILRVVEIVMEACMQRQTRTQYGAENDIVLRNILHSLTVWRHYILRGVIKFLAYFVCHNLTYALNIATETHLVLLHRHIPYLTEELVKNCILLG